MAPGDGPPAGLASAAGVGPPAPSVSRRGAAVLLCLVALLTTVLLTLSSSLTASLGGGSGAVSSDAPSSVRRRPSPSPSAYPSPDVSCLLHYGEPRTHALLNSPNKVNIFFIKTSNDTWFARSGRAHGAELHDLCALESAAAKNPGARVFLFSNALRCDALGPALAERIHLVRFDYATVFAPYPEVAAWYASGAWYGDFAVNNLSNLLRLALLHRYGGVYLDTDVLSLRGIAKARVNSLGLQAEDEVNNAVLVFRRGHSLLRAAMADAVAQFKGVWGNQGPGLLTRWWGGRSRRRGQWATVPGSRLSSSRHASVYLQPREAWYPVEHTDAGAFLQPVNVTWGYVGTIVSSSPLVHVWHSQRYKTAPEAAAARPPPSAASSHAWAHPLLPGSVYRVSQAAAELTLQEWVMGHACPAVLAAAAEEAAAAAAAGGTGSSSRLPLRLLPPDEPPLPPLPEASIYAGGLSFPAGTTTHLGPTNPGGDKAADPDAERQPVVSHPRTSALLGDARGVRTVPSILHRALAPPLTALAAQGTAGATGALPPCGATARLAATALGGVAHDTTSGGGAHESTRRAGYSLALWLRMAPQPSSNASSPETPLEAPPAPPRCDASAPPLQWAASRKQPGRYAVLRRHPSGSAYLAYYEGAPSKTVTVKSTPLVNRVSTMLPLHTSTWRHVAFTHSLELAAPLASAVASSAGKGKGKAGLTTVVHFTETVEAYVDGLLTFRRVETGNATVATPAAGGAERDTLHAQVVAAVLPAAIHADVTLLADTSLPAEWASEPDWSTAKWSPNPDGNPGHMFDALGTHAALGAGYPGVLDSAAVQALRNTQLAAVAAQLKA